VNRRVVFPIAPAAANRSSSRTLKLSAFQELMRRWEATHPCNFVCIADVDAKVGADALRDAALRTLDEMSLGILRLHKRRVYSYERVANVEVREITDPERNAALELNRPFEESDPPVRVAFVRSSDAKTTVSITCRHIAFDGHSGSVFARRILLHAIGAPIPPIEMGGNLRGRHFLANGFAWLYPQFYVHAIRDLWRMRQVYSRPMHGRSQIAIRFLPHDSDLLTQIRQAADAPGVTVNDALAARLARALLAIHADEMTSGKRIVCLSLAVSLRRGIAPLTRGIGVAAFPVFVSREDDPVRAVRQQTDIEKRSRSYLRSLIGIGIAAMLWPRTKNAKIAVHRPYVPTAGFTNVRVPSVAGDEHISNVRGVVSTGPVLPLMLVAVTHGDHLRLALVWRESRFTVDEINLVEEMLLDQNPTG
jgi:hypothetical protein